MGLWRVRTRKRTGPGQPTGQCTFLQSRGAKQLPPAVSVTPEGGVPRTMDSPPPEWLDGPHDDIDEWEVVTTNRCGAEHVVFLSDREEDKDRATFIVAEADLVRDLLEER